MKLDEQKWHNVVNAFTAASLGEGSWIESLELLADATGSRSGQLIGLGDDNAVPFNFVSDFDPQWNEVFKSADGGNPVVNPFVRAGTECSFDGVLGKNGYFISGRKGSRLARPERQWPGQKLHFGYQKLAVKIRNSIL